MAAPSEPVSPKPELMITSEPTPAAPHSWTAPRTALIGTAMTARSTLPGMAPMEGQAGTPETLSALLLTG